MHDPSKGRANSVSGIPLAGTTSQIETGSVEPNRTESAMAFHPEGKDDLGETYFKAEEERLGDNDGTYIGTKDNERWSEGLSDECNPEEDDWAEGTFAEIQPLHLVPAAASGDPVEELLDEADDSPVQAVTGSASDSNEDLESEFESEIDSRIEGESSADEPAE